MKNERLDDYNRELQAGVNNLKALLSQAQTTMGVIESFLYLVKKESIQTVEPKPLEIVPNGVSEGK